MSSAYSKTNGFASSFQYFQSWLYTGRCELEFQEINWLFLGLFMLWISLSAWFVFTWNYRFFSLHSFLLNLACDQQLRGVEPDYFPPLGANQTNQWHQPGVTALTVSGWFSKISLASSLLHSSSTHSLSRLPFLLSSNRELALLCLLRNWDALLWLRTAADMWAHSFKYNMSTLSEFAVWCS